MKVLAICAGKGGTGKTFTTVSLAAQLSISLKGKGKILIVDLDPSINSSKVKNRTKASNLVVGGNKSDPGTLMNLATLFENPSLDPKAAIYKSGDDFPGVYVLPSGEGMEFVDRLLYKQRNPDLVLKKILEKVDKDFDFALLDCPPNRGTLTSNAIACCHGYITPLDMDINAIDGVLAMHRLVEELFAEGVIIKKPLNLGAFWTRFTTKDSHANRDITKFAEEVLADHLLNIKIPESTHVKEAIYANTTLQFDKKHKVSKAYLDLTNHITSKLNQIKGLHL